jgi:LCP family protein required for cell wall assembly
VRRNGLIAAFLSALIPGLGQGYLGKWKRALLFAIPIVVGAIFAVWMVDVDTFDLLGYAVRPTVLKTILILNLAIVIWRVLAVTDAFSVSDTDRTWWSISMIVVLSAAVVAPHAVVTQYTLDAAHAIDEIFVADPTNVTPVFVAEPEDSFADDEVLPEVADPKTVISRYEPRSDFGKVFQPGVGDPDAVANSIRYVASRDRSVTDRLGSDADGVERITILLVGGDGGPGRSGSRADSINVVTMNVETGKAAVFGIPRNMTHVALPDEWSTAFVDLEKQLTPWDEKRKWTDADGDGEPDQFEPCHCFPDQINAVYPFTRGWTDTYPNERDPGLAALRDVLEIMLDLEIDYYAFVNMGGFVDVVDALGGVNVYATRPVTIEMSPAKEGDEWHVVSVGTGWNRLNGLDALGYVRERRSSSDYTRMQRQRCLLKAVAAKATPSVVLSRFSRLANAMSKSVKTDIDVSYLPTLLEYVAQLDFEDIATVGFVPPYYTPVVDFRGKPTPDLQRIRAMVTYALNADETTSFDTGDESECRV